jgi:Zn-dependent peptidase ImmA (M78 family)
MTEDAFSRALRDQRKFSAGELAGIADLLGADLHWLITGEADPWEMAVSARHQFVRETGARVLEDEDNDRRILDDIALAYRQGHGPAIAEPRPLPSTAAEVRGVLGDDFVRPFVDRLEERLGVDVIRLSDVSTAWCFSLGGHIGIVIPTNGNWFRENWDLAHELAHLCLGHSHPEDGRAGPPEAAANAFAAELLMPAERVKAVHWEEMTSGRLAMLIWDWGVSTTALANRLQSLSIRPPAVVDEWAGQPTQRLLRRHGQRPGHEITRRMDDAATRRFPLGLQESHLERIESGEIGKATLAWMLAVDEAMLDVSEPEAFAPIDADELAAILGA